MTPSPIDIAWFAGLFEGEGCIVVPAHKSSVVLVVQMTDGDIVKRVDEVWPTTRGVKHRPQEAQRRGKDLYIWRESRKPVVETILRCIMPFLGERRHKRAEEALDHLASRPGQGAARNQTHCKRGHPYTGDNVIWRTRPSGKVQGQCRICKNALEREAYQRQRAA